MKNFLLALVATSLALVITLAGAQMSNRPSGGVSDSADVIGLWTGTCDNTTWLRGDGACAAPAGAGTVDTTGTPEAGQAAEFTDADTIQGVAVTGTGSYVKATSPTLVTPVLGAATGTSLVLSGNITAANLTPSGTLTDTALCFYATASGINCTTLPDNVRQTFNPGANAAGLNVGSHAGDPDTPSNGDIWYDSTANELTARINGANVALGAGGGSDTYALQASTIGSFAPNDATSYYISGMMTASTNTGQHQLFIPTTGTITAVYCRIHVQGTAPTNEQSTIAVRYDNTTNTNLSTVVDISSGGFDCSATGLSIAVTAGHYIALYWTTPTWATNPTQVSVMATIKVTVP